jgi:soluble lytic murein transglycosylase-like protein
LLGDSNFTQVSASQEITSKQNYLIFFDNSNNKITKYDEKKVEKLTDYFSKKYALSKDKAKKIIMHVFLESSRKNIEPLLVLSLIEVESAFKQYSRSSVGAIGYMQIMPRVHAKMIRKKYNKIDLWSVNGNISVGTEILHAYLITSEGDVVNALQMYNGNQKDKSVKYTKKVLNNVQNLIVALR